MKQKKIQRLERAKGDARHASAAALHAVAAAVESLADRTLEIDLAKLGRSFPPLEHVLQRLPENAVRALLYTGGLVAGFVLISGPYTLEQNKDTYRLLAERLHRLDPFAEIAFVDAFNFAMEGRDGPDVAFRLGRWIVGHLDPQADPDGLFRRACEILGDTLFELCAEPLKQSAEEALSGVTPLAQPLA